MTVLKNSAIHLVVFVPLLLAALATGGCATGGIPKAMRAEVTPGVAFKEVLAAPENYKDTTVMWSGRILSVKNEKEGTTLQIIETPSDADGRPLTTDRSEGRFIAYVDRYLDRVVYRANREVTVIGKVDGARKLPLAEGEMEYVYPYVLAEHVHLWPGAHPAHWGRSAYGDPYTYGPYPGPWWYNDPLLYGFPDRPIIIERHDEGLERRPPPGEGRRDRR